MWGWNKSVGFATIAFGVEREIIFTSDSGIKKVYLHKSG